MYNKRYNYGGDNYLYYLREFSNLVADTFSNGNRAYNYSYNEKGD